MVRLDPAPASNLDKSVVIEVCWQRLFAHDSDEMYLFGTQQRYGIA